MSILDIVIVILACSLFGAVNAILEHSGIIDKIVDWLKGGKND